MEIKLESNRKFLFKFLFPLIILLTAIIIGLLITDIVAKSTPDVLIIILAIIDFVYVLALIFVWKRKKPVFMFSSDEIIYNKKNKENIIEVSNIKSMTYIKTKWYDWFLLIFVILLGDSGGSAMPVIDIEEKDGKKHQLGFFSKNEIEILKKLYGSLLNIK